MPLAQGFLGGTNVQDETDKVKGGMRQQRKECEQEEEKERHQNSNKECI